jgi:16S rRNA processing protein RimM
MAPPDRESLLALGKLGAPHGLRGEFRFIAYCGEDSELLDLIDPEIAGENPLVYLGLRERPDLPLVEARVDSFRGGAPGKLLIGFELAPDRTAAEALPRYEVFLPGEDLRGALEEESFLCEDVIGCAAVDPSGAPIGEVIEVELGAAQDMLLIRPAEESGKKVFRVPFVHEIALSVDLKKRRVVLKLPEGLDEL